MRITKSQLNYKPVQLILPMNYEHIIDKHDPVVSFLEVVGGLRLDKYINTSSIGRQDYNPEMMLHLILFGFMEGIRSLRALEKACRTDIRFMHISKGKKPSFMAFQRFIDQKLNESIDDIFYEINEFLIEKESINTNVLYLDGTKIEANATKFSFVWKKAVLNYQAKLYLKITDEFNSIKKNTGIHFTIKESYKPRDLDAALQTFRRFCDYRSIEFVHGKGQRKTLYQRHYEHLLTYRAKLTDYAQHIEICGNRNSYSKTDHDATFMHGKEDYYSNTGIFKPYYNLQIGVSDEYILHMGIYPNPTDTKTFIPFFKEYHKRYGMLPEFPVADSGYGSYDNYMYCLDHKMKLYMKYTMFNKENEAKFKKRKYHIKNVSITKDKIIAGDGSIYNYSHDYENRKGKYPQIKQVFVRKDWNESLKEEGIPQTISRDIVLLQLQEEARKNLKSATGNHLRVQRSIQVEGAFGDIKSNSEYTRVHRRGIRGVQTELTLVLIAYNLRKYHAKKFRKMN